MSHLASRTPSATFLLRSYGYGATGVEPRLYGEDCMTVLDSVRATSAAPWYMEEISVFKNLTTGEVCTVAPMYRPLSCVPAAIIPYVMKC